VPEIEVSILKKLQRMLGMMIDEIMEFCA